MNSPTGNPKLFTFLTALTVLFIISSCSKERAPLDDLKNYIPANSAYILQAPDLKSFLKKIDSLSLIQENPNLISREFFSQLRDLAEYTEPGLTYVSFGRSGDGPFNFTYLKKGQQEKMQLDSVQNKSLETFTFEEFQIHKYVIENVITYTSFINGIFIASNSREQLEEILKAEENSLLKNVVFDKILAAADPKKSSIFINHSYFDKEYDDIFPEGLVPIISLAEWSLLDLELESNKILLNGISVSSEGANNLLQVFTDVNSQPNELAKVSPVSAAGFYSFTYDRFSLLYDNLTKFRNSKDSLPNNHLLNYTSEAGIIFGKNSKLMVLRATDAELAKEVLLPQQNNLRDYRGITIYSSEMVKDIPEYLNPLIKLPELKHFIWLDEFMVLSETAEELEDIISNFLNKSTIFHQEYYTDAISNLADNSSMLIVANSTEIKSSLRAAVSNEFKEDIEQLNLDNYPLIALQFIKEKEFTHVHGVFNTTKNNIKNDIQQLTSFSLDTQPGTPGFLLRNHSTNQIEIAVQDDQNNLYLFSATGKRLWKKQLNSRIVGGIQQVDLNKNGNLQLAFTTLNSFHILDRNGNPVKPFPIDLKDDITQSLSVFDYDNNRNYRFVVTQGNSILMYDSKGKLVTGFEPGTIGSSIAQAPKHIRFNNKDFIIFSEEDGNINILDRQGRSRIAVKEKIELSDNDWFDFENKFVSTTSTGEIVMIRENGNAEKRLSGISALSANNKVLATLSENVLTINDNEISLDFGLYTKPKIFSLGDKTFISLTDTQANRSYVFDEKGDLITGFPVYGSTEAEILSLDGMNYISVLGEENEIILYRF